MFMSLDLGNNLCSGALHQVEPVAETLINSRGKYHYSSNSTYNTSYVTLVIKLHPTVDPPPFRHTFCKKQNV